MPVQLVYSSKRERANSASGTSNGMERIISSKVYDSPDLAENEATFAIGPQGIMNADG